MTLEKIHKKSAPKSAFKYLFISFPSAHRYNCNDNYQNNTTDNPVSWIRLPFFRRSGCHIGGFNHC